jgi:NAD(P)-dependent dehydrogenase (short-subunit alcohol dehydrogenase family)
MTATRPVALATGASSGIGKAVSAATGPKPGLRYTAGPAAGRVSTLRRIVSVRQLRHSLRHRRGRVLHPR